MNLVVDPNTVPLELLAGTTAGGSPRSSTRPRLIAIAIAMLIGLGIFFRLYHIDHKAFWDDEVIASMHILGLPEAQVVLSAANFHHFSDLHDVMHPAHHTSTITDTIHTLETEDPQHPPGYYVLAHIWVNFFGDSVAALRLLSAIIGLFALPCMFWLCLELTRSIRSAWLGTVLIAVSPVAILFSQQIREYSLWLVTILVMSALFFRALRTASTRIWALYACSVGLSLYVFPASVLLAVAHLAAALLTTTSRRNRFCAIGAVLTGVVLFLPWLVVILTHVGQINRGMAVINTAHVSPLGVARALADLVRLDVLDIDTLQRRIVMIAAVPIIGLLGYVLFAVRRLGTPASTLFVWTTVICTVLPYVLLDLLSGGQRTASTRYFMAFFVAIDVALVVFISAKTLSAGEGSKVRDRAVWFCVIGAVLGARIGSCVVSSQAQTWWDEYNIRSIAVAAELNHAPHPLLMSDDYIVWALSLSEYAKPDIDVVLQPRCYLCAIPPPLTSDMSAPKHATSIFLLAPSKSLRYRIEHMQRTSRAEYYCINVRNNCSGDLSMF